MIYFERQRPRYEGIDGYNLFRVMHPVVVVDSKKGHWFAVGAGTVFDGSSVPEVGDLFLKVLHAIGNDDDKRETSSYGALRLVDTGLIHDIPYRIGFLLNTPEGRRPIERFEADEWWRGGARDLAKLSSAAQRAGHLALNLGASASFQKKPLDWDPTKERISL